MSQLRDEIVLALCTDHGHLNQAGALKCKTCNRRADRMMEIIAARFGAESTTEDGTPMTDDRMAELVAAKEEFESAANDPLMPMATRLSLMDNIAALDEAIERLAAAEPTEDGTP